MNTKRYECTECTASTAPHYPIIRACARAVNKFLVGVHSVKISSNMISILVQVRNACLFACEGIVNDRAHVRWSLYIVQSSGLKAHRLKSSRL